MVILLLLLVGGFIMWLLKCNSKFDEVFVVGFMIIVDNDEVLVFDFDIGDFLSVLVFDFDDKVELLDDDLFNDDDLFDDVFILDLEESLDDELEIFVDFEDDMLVLDDGSDDLFEVGDDEFD